MKPGIYSEFGETRSIFVNEVNAIIRNGKRRTDRYWKWWVMDETTQTVIANGTAPTKEEAVTAAKNI